VRDTAIYRKFKTKAKKRALYSKRKKLLDKHPEVKKMIDPKFVSSLDPERGKYLGKVNWMPTELVITDQRIREMCRNMFTYPEEYVKATGLRFGPCPGLERMSGCPMFSPRPEEVRVKLNNADVFIALQSKYFVKRPEITGWHEFLIRKLKKAVEKVEGKGSAIVTFGSGPCQLCHPNPCLGGGKCRAPNKRLFSPESVGIPVGQLCNDMALLTGDNGWKLGWMKYYGTPRQTRNRWKFTFGLAVRLNRKKKN
jgi:predicted metal-binding protein